MDGYALIRKSTLAWLLERHRRAPDEELPIEVARDLGEAVVGVEAPQAAEDPLRALGPILTAEEHIELLTADRALGLPADKGAAQFWHVVVRVVLGIMSNEGQAALRIIGGKHGK